MKSIANYRALIILIFIFFTGMILSYTYYPIETKSNALTAFVTFLVGTIAIYLYIAQKEDYKKDGANIILMEIRNAEKISDQIKKGEFSAPMRTERLLPTNNWTKYNYLFIRDFDRDELDSVNDFYNQCAIIDHALSQINISKQLEQKAGYIQQKLAEIAKEATNLSDYTTKRDSFIQLMSTEGYTFPPSAPTEILEKTLANMTKITNSNAGAKLKKIAGIK